MIHPNMATMLGVVTCDADVEVELWRALFKRAAVKSFNQARSCCALHERRLQSSCCLSRLEPVGQRHV